MEESIKKLLKSDSEKLIIVENGKPKFVVMTYDHYQKIASEEKKKENFDMNFNDLFLKQETARGTLEIEADKGLVEKRDEDENNKDLSLDDLPIA